MRKSNLLTLALILCMVVSLSPESFARSCVRWSRQNGYKVSVQAHDQPVSAVLKTIFEQAHQIYRIEPCALNILQRAHCNAHISDMSMQDAVDLILVQGRTFYQPMVTRIDNEVEIVDLNPVNLSLVNDTPRTAFEKLFEGCGADYIYWDNGGILPKIDLQLTRIPFQVAYEQIVKELEKKADLKTYWLSGVCIVCPRHPLEVRNTRHGQYLSCQFHATELAVAIEALFASYYASYTAPVPLTEKVTLEPLRRSFINACLDALTAKYVLNFRPQGGTYKCGILLFEPRMAATQKNYSGGAKPRK